MLFLYSKWSSLPLHTRNKIAGQFGFKKKGPTEVFDNQVKSDGYLIKDIEGALNIDAIQSYLGVSETDMMTLWLWMVDKIEGRELTQVNMDTTVDFDKSLEEKKKDPEFNAAFEKEKTRLEKLNKPKRGRPKAK